ncbi:arylamine N-acetyltransferase family protein [Aspergillus puulaauensis]|uniref:N-terminal acetyltransferase n=1 Tax=Aspergillus puulaauensis TaxID=1220207 RepID=A0A7R7XN34_9EURO|nr:N-terminal acetyltransferase [Aspergillus puulaauensis]BCS24571.1 N-terminal acetyltransferase [Aspergillus puulaauensis]
MPPRYTPDQLEAYLQRIGYANSTGGTGLTRLQQLHQSIQEDALSALADLQRRHLGSIPWGNSAIHYSQHHSISTHPSAVFEKLVVRRLDGYCMENTNLFYVVLLSLGYQVYPSAGRVSSAAADPKNAGPDARYGALGHMVIIVTVDNKKYMVDVGFGNNVPTRPLPLEENTTTVNIAPTDMRLVKEALPEAVDKSQKFWIYQIRFDPESNWAPLYAFSEVEFLPQDFGVLNFATNKLPSSWFTQKVVTVQHILDAAGSDIEGLYIMAGKEVKVRTNGKTEVVQELQNEEDRVGALEKWFGIKLLDYEAAGIQGLGSELR